MSYIKPFDPPRRPAAGSSGYVYDEDIVLAVNVALATARPLLLRGAPGCGKSTLARDVARNLRRTYYEDVVTSRSEARDLLWRFDAVRRLNDRDASAPLSSYVEPRALWRAFDPSTARAYLPALDDAGGGAVVLLDEIDKAEPDVPNDLLVPLGARPGEVAFRVQETGQEVTLTRPVLVMLTTNEERDLPNAFMRRCIVLEVHRPDVEGCVTIARAHFEEAAVGRADLLAVAQRFAQLVAAAEAQELRPPGTAEYLDAVRALVQLGLPAGPPDRQRLVDRALWKHRDAPRVAASA